MCVFLYICSMKNIIKEKAVQEVLAPFEDPFDWERHCGSCDYFGDEDRCPFYNVVKNAPETYYEDIGCKNFWD